MLGHMRGDKQSRQDQVQLIRAYESLSQRVLLASHSRINAKC